MEKAVGRLGSFLVFVGIVLSGPSSAHGVPANAPRGSSRPQGSGWTTSGPKGAVVTALTARDNVLYAATGRGVYRSRDGGNRWELGLAGGVVRSLTIDPADSSVVFAAMQSVDGRSLFKSADGGRSWRAIAPGSKNPGDMAGGPVYAIHSLAVDPRDSRVVYAGTARNEDLGSGAILKSLDGGESWAPAGPGFSAVDVMDLEIDPADPRTVYAVTSGGPSGRSRLVRSKDGGATWTEIGAGLPGNDSEPSSPAPLRSVSLDPRDRSALYVATYDQGVYRSRDAGSTWQPANDGLPRLKGYPVYPIVEALSWDPDGALYAGLDPYGLFKSADGGDHWTPLNFGAAVTSLSAGVGARSLVYVVGPRGIYRSRDGGASWTESDGGIVGSVIPTVATDPTMPGAVYAGSSFPSTPTFGEWDPGDGRWMPPDGLGFGVFRSLDRGRTWSRTSLPPGYLEAMAVDPRTGSIYALVWGTLFKSTDHGVTWSALPPSPEIKSIVIDSAHSRIYAATWFSGIQRSEDGGSSWTAMNNGLPEGEQSQVTSLAMDPDDPAVLYAATVSSGVYKTRDGGATWAPVNNGLTYVEACPGCLSEPRLQMVERLAVDPARPRILYAAALDTGSPDSGGIFKSEDGGTTWRPAGEGLRTRGSRQVRDLVVDPRDGGSVYIATDEGVFRSDADEMSWQPMNEDISDLQVFSVALDPNPPGALHAGTGAGVYTLHPLPGRVSRGEAAGAGR